MAERVIETVQNIAQTGKIGDGKIFVFEMSEAIRSPGNGRRRLTVRLQSCVRKTAPKVWRGFFFKRRSVQSDSWLPLPNERCRLI